ncbi:MAG: hypothetical protein KDJ45_08850 [Hyphomicrobiaceae bacterium]|nr:hypothetical protein [Hyphomicrobiaceae bacterium]MCC0009776.1 hypothetical protein [Hyphomicrobiaceae bacterium]
MIEGRSLAELTWAFLKETTIGKKTTKVSRRQVDLRRTKAGFVALLAIPTLAHAQTYLVDPIEVMGSYQHMGADRVLRCPPGSVVAIATHTHNGQNSIGGQGFKCFRSTTLLEDSNFRSLQQNILPLAPLPTIVKELTERVLLLERSVKTLSDTNDALTKRINDIRASSTSKSEVP